MHIIDAPVVVDALGLEDGRSLDAHMSCNASKLAAQVMMLYVICNGKRY